MITKLNKMFGKGIFSSDKVNTGRQLELDIAKGFAIIFMIWVHTLETFGSGTGLGSTIVENILGGPFAAPVFMVAMGIGMQYGRHNSADSFIKRGVKIFITGIVLNVFRYVLPMLIATTLTGEKTFLNTYSSLVEVDILQFAGLALIAIGLSKKWHWSNKTLLLVAVFASIVGAFLHQKYIGNIYIDHIFGYIWGNGNAQTYFPFLNWFIFPVFGYFFGNLLQYCRDKGTLYKRIALPAGILGLGYIISALVFKFGMYGTNGFYYFLGPIDAFFVLNLVVGIFGFCYLLLPFRESRVIKGITQMSNRINTVYCFQWLIIGNAGILLISFLPTSGLNFLQVTLLAFIILILSAFGAKWYLAHPFLQLPKIKPIFVAVTVLLILISLYGQTQATDISSLYVE